MESTFFKDPALQQQFDRDGFVVFPFLSEEELERLRKHYACCFEERPTQFYSSTFIQDPQQKAAIHEPINEVLRPVVDRHLRAYQALGTSFLVKPPGPAGKMQVHQDWTIVDETRYCSATIWIPLVDTTVENGALRVLPGSHRFLDVVRGPSLPVVYEHLYSDLWEQMHVLEMKAGEAFIFNQALIHASHTNHSGRDRVAATFGFVPEDAQLKFFHREAAGPLEEYAVDVDFFQQYTAIGRRPEIGRKVAEHQPLFSPVSRLELERKINQHQRMKPIFKEAAMQAQFEEQGYTTKRVFSPEEVDKFRTYFENLPLKDQSGYGFFVSMDDPQRELVDAVTDTLFAEAIPLVLPHFRDAKPFTAAFVTKDPNPQGVVPVHQDWTFVDDEGEYYSVNCWVPLVDVTIENGALGVIKGSHRLLSDVRPSPSPQVVSPLRDHMFSLFPYVQLVELKAGEAIFFDNRTFHASPPNVTEGQRIVIGMGFTQADAQLCHYYMKPDGKQDTLLKYHIDTAFFRKYNNALLGQMYERGELIDDYPVVASIPYHQRQLDTDELVSEVKAAGNSMNAELIEQLAKLFQYNLDGTKKEGTATDPTAPPEDSRSFWQIYTPGNIYREIRYRLTGK